MALQLGSMYVSLSARTSAFAKGMASAMGSLERFAKEAKKVSADVAQFSGALSAIGIGAVKLASTVDGPTKAAMTGLEQSTKLLAVQVADMLLPAVRELTAMFQKAAGIVAGLDPEMKKQVSTFAVMAVQVAFAAKALSMFSGIAGSAFGVLKSALSMIAAVGTGPLLSIALGVAGVVAMVVLLHRAWRKNWGGIQETTGEVVEWLRGAFQQFAEFMGKVWNFVIDGAARFVEAILGAIDALQELTGKKLIDTGGLREGFNGLWKDLKSGSFFADAFKFGKTVGQQVAEGLAEEFALIKAELVQKLGLDKLTKGGRAKPIGLGRGMGSASPIKSGAVGGALSQAMKGTVSVAPLVDEVDAAAKALSQQNVQSELLRREMQARAAAEAAAAASLDRMMAARATGNTQSLTKTEKKEFSQQNSEVLAEAVGAGDWAAAQAKLRDGLKGAYTFGAELAVWGARMGPMVAGMGKQLLGEVGNLIGAIAEGAELGGLWGAIIAAIMEIAKKTESAMRFLDVAMEFVSQLAGMLEPLVKPIFDALTNVLGVVVDIIEPVFAALKPLFENVGKFVDQLAPILYAVGDVLQAVAPVLEVIGKVVGVIFEALDPLIQLIAGILKVVATVILGVIIALNEIAAAFGDKAAAAESAKLKGIVDSMWSRTPEQERANMQLEGETLRNAAAQGEAADAAQKVAESLSNVPSGYKLAMARYTADLGIGTAGAATVAAGGGGFTVNGDVNITSSAGTVDELAEDARRQAERERAQRRGSRRTGGGADGGDL